MLVQNKEKRLSRASLVVPICIGNITHVLPPRKVRIPQYALWLLPCGQPCFSAPVVHMVITSRLALPPVSFAARSRAAISVSFSLQIQAQAAASHTWKLYVRAPDNADLSHVISKARPSC